MFVFITGASSGIGEACARAFAAAQFNLVLAARREDRILKLSEELANQHGVSVHPFHLDVRNRGSLTELVQQHAGIIDQVDVLINNAGLAKGLSFIQDGNVEDWDDMIDTNVKGLLYVTQAILPKMIARGHGHIVNIGSVAGHWVYERGAVYCASKYAVRAINEAMRLDLQNTGIRVSSVSPGMVETEFSEVRLGDPERAKEVYQGRKPLTAQDIAETVLWCVQRPAHVNIQEVIMFPTDQPSVNGQRR